MGPIQDDYSILLLVIVALVCGTIAGLPGLFAPGASMAAGKPAVQLASQTSVRIVGTPFVPNTNPRER